MVKFQQLEQSCSDMQSTIAGYFEEKQSECDHGFS